jgi:hypothetical protein
MTVRDAGEILDVSHQRVAQLLATADDPDAGRKAVEHEFGLDRPGTVVFTPGKREVIGTTRR